MKFSSRASDRWTPLSRRSQLSKRARVFVSLLAFFICGQQLATAQLTDNGQSDSIHGTVINSVTREPVGHALVYSPDNRFATMTDSDGHFEFTLPKMANPESAPGGKTEGALIAAAMNRPDLLMARKPGFLETGGGESTASGDEITIALVPEALIVGRVSLPTTEAAERIQVELYRRQVREGRPHWVVAGSVTTRSNGEFRFSELPAGSYKLLTREMLDRDPLTFDPRGQLYGYPPVYYPAASDFTTAGILQVGAGKIFHADLTVVRQPYFPVKVRVTNAPPGNGVNVIVSVQGHRGPGFALGYNYQDQMIEGMLPNGSYTLEATTFGPVTASGVTSISVHGGPFEGGRMALVPDSHLDVNVRY